MSSVGTPVRSLKGKERAIDPPEEGGSTPVAAAPTLNGGSAHLANEAAFEGDAVRPEKKQRIAFEDRVAADTALRDAVRPPAPPVQPLAPGPSSASRAERVEEESVDPIINQSSSDLYFTAFGSAAGLKRRKKGKTASDALVSKALPDLTPAMIATARDSTLMSWSATRMEELSIRLHRHRYPEWSGKLESGFSLLFHGTGSIERLLTDYVETRSESGQGAFVVLRGYVPGIRAEAVLEACEAATAASEMAQWDGELESFAAEHAAEDARQRAGDDDAEVKYGSALEARAHRMRLKYSSTTALPPLQVLAIGVDHRSMLTARMQTVLAILAKAPRIFLIGTASHINAGLLLGPSDAAMHVPWLWQDLETFVPPFDELLVNASYRKLVDLPRVLQLHLHSGRSSGADSRGAQAVAAGADLHEPLSTTFPPSRAQSIIAQITPKAKKLFVLTARLQLGEDPSKPAASAAASTAQAPVPINVVYEHATRQFLANNLDTVKNLLVEGLSHGLIRLVKWSDADADLAKLQQGQEYLWINMAPATLADLVKHITARL